jgi:hypothetical protein
MTTLRTLFKCIALVAIGASAAGCLNHNNRYVVSPTEVPAPVRETSEVLRLDPDALTWYIRADSADKANVFLATIYIDRKGRVRLRDTGWIQPTRDQNGGVSTATGDAETKAGGMPAEDDQSP